MRPGAVDWIFRWRTVGIKGSQRRDAVTIENFKGYDSEDDCYLGIEPGVPRVLRWGDPGVTFSIRWNGTYWVHEARWAGLPAVSNCQYRYKVTSGIGNGVTTTGPLRTMPSYLVALQPVASTDVSWPAFGAAPFSPPDGRGAMRRSATTSAA